MEGLMLLDETVVVCVPRRCDPAENPEFNKIEARYGNDPDLLIGALAGSESALAVSKQEYSRLKQIHSRLRSALRQLRESYIAVFDEVITLRRQNNELTQKLHATALELEMAKAQIAESDRDYSRVVQRCDAFENRLIMLTQNVLHTASSDGDQMRPTIPESSGSILPLERLYDDTAGYSLLS
jgi:septal ring factor EnvC (AmiA/AmiB activator)